MIKIYKGKKQQLKEHSPFNLTCTACSRELLFKYFIMIFIKYV